MEPSGPLQACNGTALPDSWTIKYLILSMDGVTMKRFLMSLRILYTYHMFLVYLTTLAVFMLQNPTEKLAQHIPNFMLN